MLIVKDCLRELGRLMGIGTQGNFLISATSASKDGIVASNHWDRKHTNIFIIIDGQRGERTQLVPERLQRTGYE